jgi:integrase
MVVRLKGVYRNRKTLSDGTKRDYYSLRGFGALKPLAGDEGEPFKPGTPAFMRAYDAATRAPLVARTTGTLQSIIDGYQKSPQWAKLAPRTKRDYIDAIAKIETAKILKTDIPLGAVPLEVIEDPKIRPRFLGWRDKMAETSPRQADATFGVLRIMLEWGRDRGLVSHNHALRPKKVYKADRADKLWLPEHIEAIRAVAAPDIRLAFELALGTGQRKGDLLKLAWTCYVDGRIRFRQGKRKRLVDMPVTKALGAVLAAEPRKAATILTCDGSPWFMSKAGKASHFDHQWRKTFLAAGLRDTGLHFHDIRGTTCTELGEAGCTPSEIAAMLGWTVSTVNRMLDTYQAQTAAQSNSAVAKLEARRNAS